MHKSINVLEFPPNDERRILVKGEFLYGIKVSFFPSLFNEITCVKKNKLLLICCPSLTLSLILTDYKTNSLSIR